MNFKEFLRTIQRALTRGVFHLFVLLLRNVSYPTAKAIFAPIRNFGLFVTRRHQKIAEDALKTAFGKEKSHEEISGILKTCFYSTAQNMLEAAYFGLHPGMLKEKVIIEGEEHLKKALRAGQGAIAVTAHFGNFPLMMLRFAKDYPTNVIIRPARDPQIEKSFNKFRAEGGIRTIHSLPRKECVAESIRALRNNELLFIPLDQNFSTKGGVFVDFFGQKAATATGPVVFAQRTGAPLVPVFILRDKDDIHKIIVEEPFHIEEKQDNDATVLFNVQKITGIIEKYIRRYPHEWGWMTRRWKDRPAENTASVKEDADVS